MIFRCVWRKAFEDLVRVTVKHSLLRGDVHLNENNQSMVTVNFQKVRIQGKGFNRSVKHLQIKINMMKFFNRFFFFLKYNGYTKTTLLI